METRLAVIIILRKHNGKLELVFKGHFIKVVNKGVDVSHRHIFLETHHCSGLHEKFPHVETPTSVCI